MLPLTKNEKKINNNTRNKISVTYPKKNSMEKLMRIKTVVKFVNTAIT